MRCRIRRSRGSQPTWPNQRGFVGGYQDPTGLTHLGAREYDPTTGRFLSVDPLIDVGDPQQIHGYSYAGNNPTTYSDPDGLIYTDFLDQSDPHFGSNQAGNCRGGYDCQDKADKGTYRGAEIKWRPPPSATEQIVHESLCTLMIACRPALFISDTADLYRAAESGEPAAIAGALGAYVPICVGSICKKVADYIAERVQSMLGRSAKGAADSALNSASRRAADEAAERGAQRAGAPYVAPAGPKPPSPPRKPAGGSGPTTTKANSGGPSCRHSFAPDTRVLLADGDTKRIDEVAEGDRVLAHDPETGRTSAEVVTDLHVNRDRELTDLVVRTEDGEFVTLETTQHHPFWSESREEWVDAGELRAAEWLKTATGERVTVAKVRNFLGAETMRDLTVANLHTYYVLAGETPVLVHNCGGSINPSLVRFSQDTVSPRFSTGETIEQTAAALRSGYTKPTDLPAVRLTVRGGQIYSLDNRRLVAFQKAGIQMPFRMATPEEAANEAWKFTTQNEGRSIMINYFDPVEWAP